MKPKDRQRERTGIGQMETQQTGTEQQRVRPDVSSHHFNHSEMGRILFTVSVRRIANTRDAIPFKIERVLEEGTTFVVGLSFCSFDDEPSREKGRLISLGRIDSFLKRKVTESRDSDRFIATFKDEDSMVSWLKMLRSREDDVTSLLTFLQNYFKFNPSSWMS